MKQYGEYLRELREARGLSIEKVSEDTNIVIEVIEALETMNKGKIASEVHLVGFIKLYTKYLGGDEKKALSLLRSTALSETPIEFDVINISRKKKKQKSKHSLIFFIVPIIIVLCSTGLWWAYSTIRTFMAQRAAEKSSAKQNVTTVDRIYEKTFALRENIALVKGEAQATAVVASISPPIISIGEIKYVLEKNVPTHITLAEGIEYVVILRAINVAKRSLLLRFDPRSANPRVPQAQQKPAHLKVQNPVEQVLKNADGKVFQILSTSTAEPIQMRLIAKVTGAAYYEYETLEESAKGFVNEPIEKTVPATQHIDLYVSNAVAVALYVNKILVPLPAKSLPFVLRLGWQEKNPGESTLLAVPLP